MNDLKTAAQQALEALEQGETSVPYEGFGMARREAERKHQAAITALKAALAQERDAELSAALGWPGGISDPVLDRKTLLRKVAELRAALAQEPAEAWICPEAPEVRYDKPGPCWDCGKPLVLAHNIK